MRAFIQSEDATVNSLPLLVQLCLLFYTRVSSALQKTQLFESHKGSNMASDFEDKLTVGNETYCWNDNLQAYSWCPTTPLEAHENNGSKLVYVIPFLYGSISLLSIVGNTLVIWIVSSTKSMHGINNYLLTNLAISDLAIAIFWAPFQVHAALVQKWLLPPVMCKLCPLAQTFSVNISIFTMVALAQERYHGIMSPLSSVTSSRPSKLIFTLIWMSAFVLRVVSS